MVAVKGGWAVTPTPPPNGMRRLQKGVLGYLRLGPGRITKRCEKSSSKEKVSVIPCSSMTTKLRQSTALYFLSW